jgi:mannose-6-phosphate isomerase-like protein (cupin superfamily)
MRYRRQVAGFAVTNLKDVEDQAVKFGLSPQMEARFAREDLASEAIALSYQRLAPNVRQPYAHRHRADEEIYVVVGGSGRVLLEGELVELGQWDAVRVAPHTVRAFAAGPDGLEILAFGTHRENDVESLQPEWPDDGGSSADRRG